MLQNLTKINKYREYLEPAIILFFFWISINTGSKYLNINYLNQHDLGILVNLIRSLLPYVIVFYFLLNFKLLFKNSFKNIDLFYKLFFVYGFFQLIGLIYNYENLYEHYWIVCLLAVILFFNIAQKSNNEILYNNIFLINIIFVGIVFSVFIFLTFKKNIFVDDLLYHSEAFREYYNHEKMPRSTGLARMSLIIFIFLNAIYFSKVSIITSKKILFILNIFLISIVFILQSRGVILSLFLILILVNVIYNFNNFKHRFVYNLLLIIFPILISLSYPSVKESLNKFYNSNKLVSSKNETNYNILKLNNKIDLKIRKDFFIFNKEEGILNNLSSLSNNRFLAWDFLIQIFFKQELNDKIKTAVKHQHYDMSGFKYQRKKNILTGYGPQADRHLMFNISNSDKRAKDIEGPFGSNASNGYIYSLVSSGILGFFVFCLINLLIFFKIIKIIFKEKKKYFNSNPFLSSSIICILFLQFRILFENSFSVYGVDMLILFSSYLIIQNEYKNKQIEK